MKLSVYFRFLRPLRSLVFVACPTSLAWAAMKGPFGFEENTARLFALAVSLPQLLGFLIAGAAQEPMHRPFALLLPAIRQRQRLAATGSIIVAALAVTIGVAWAVPGVSAVATCGLAGALVALPCLARNQSKIHWPLGSCLIGVLLAPLIGPGLAPAMNAFPWLFLLGGVIIVPISLLRGFSRTSLRSRASTFFVSYQSSTFTLKSQREIARSLAESIEYKKQSKQNQLPSGRDWTVRSVGPTSRDWMQVFSHASSGGHMHGSLSLAQKMGPIMTFTFGLGAAGLACAVNHLSFWTNLARLAATDITNGMPAAMLQPGMIVICALALPQQRIAYPISRVRLAQIEFWQIAVQSATALAGVTGSIFLLSLVGQFVTGKTLPALGLPNLIAVDLAMAMLLPCFIVVSRLKRPGLRIFGGVPTIGAIMLTSFLHSHGGELLFTPPGILLWLLAAALSQGVLWWRLHRHYASVDLIFGTGIQIASPFGEMTINRT